MAIDKYRNQSGFHWDNSRGANIVGTDAKSVWASYLQPKVRHCPYLYSKSI